MVPHPDRRLDQRIHLIARPRHFGGRQWYFICPYMNRRVSVLWKPTGAEIRVSAEMGAGGDYLIPNAPRTIDRAHRGEARIKSRLCSIGGFDPDEWDFPPKPKWMRWPRYKRAEEQFARIHRSTRRAAAMPLMRGATTVPLLGYLSSISAADRPHHTEAFRQGLNETGYAEARNVTIEYRYADNRMDQLRPLAADLIARKVAVISAAVAGNNTALVAKTLTSTNPDPLH